jgi:SulP family sulfate permease
MSPPASRAPHRIVALLEQWLPVAIATLVSGIMGILVTISFASLIFAGDLKGYLAQGIGMALFTSVVMRPIVAWKSSLPGVVADTDALPCAILAVIAAGIYQQMAENATPEQVFVTIAAAIALTSIFTGVLLLVFGFLKVGELTRFIPYPVVGGFIASSGWLLVHGAFPVLTDQALTFGNLTTFLTPAVLLQWLPALLYGIGLVWASRRWDHPLLLPIGLVVAVGLVYVSLLLAYGSLSAPPARPWLLETIPAGNLWQPPPLHLASQVDGSALLSQWGNIASVGIISSVLILLTVSGLEVLTKQDANLNRELKVAGIANFFSGLGGGMVGVHALGDTALAYQMGAGTRLIGGLTALLTFSVMFLGSSALSYFPRPVLGSLLVCLGLSLLLEWLYDAWFKLPRSEYLVVVLILLVVATAGIVPGLMSGAIASIVLFIINYSQIAIAKHTLSGKSYRSRVERPAQQAKTLTEQGDQIYILELQGFIFFGTAHQLLNQIQQRLTDPDSLPLKFIILDFRQVTGIDSSTTFSFVKLKRLLEQHDLQLVLTNLQSRPQEILQRADFTSAEDGFIHIFPDLDRGMEWCEQKILEAVTWRRKRFTPITLQLQKVFPDPDQVAPFVKYLDKQTLEPGEWLFRAGDRATAIYFIEAGQISTFRGDVPAQITPESAQAFRVQTLGTGTTVGEIEFHRRTTYDVSALCDRPTTLYSLTIDSLEKLQQENPQAAIAFHQFISKLLSERLSQVYQELESLIS